MKPDQLAALESKLADPLWRLCSGELYEIKTADGQGVIPFIPRPEQEQILVALLRAVEKRGPQQIAYLKSRRLGCSTTIGVFMADCISFRKGFTATLIDQTQKDDATKKLNGIVKVALDSLMAKFPQRRYEKSNDSAVAVSLLGKYESEFYAGTKARGGSNDFLWVSEWGPIQFDDPGRSAEIRSGALPSARFGVKVIETTWKGGKGGDLWEVLEPTISGKAHDWEIVFFPWYIDPRNVAPHAAMDEAAERYFAKIAPRLALTGVTLSDAQMRWWAMERRAQGIFMARENPTFLDECWTSPVPGAVYAEAIERARSEGRICPMPVDGSNLVNTSWDLGSPENTSVWYWQVVGREVRFIDCDRFVDSKEPANRRGFTGTLTQRAAHMIAKGYQYGAHYLPHDAQQTERTGTTLATELGRTGLPGRIVTVPRTHDVWVGINHGIEMFPALSFRSPHCDDGLDALGAYRTRPQSEGSVSVDEPVHDWASHPSDAFRVMAEAHRAGLVSFKHTTAEARPDYYSADRPKRRGMKAMRVS